MRSRFAVKCLQGRNCCRVFVTFLRYWFYCMQQRDQTCNRRRSHRIPFFRSPMPKWGQLRATSSDQSRKSAANQKSANYISTTSTLTCRPNFWSDALDRLGITIDLSREEGACIPAHGPVVAVANHPYGVIDGLVLCSLMSQVRSDYKIITHRVLRQAPAIRDMILPIDFDETEAALATNLETRIAATQHLKNDGAVIIFPAGSISLAPKLVGDAYDIEWKSFAAKLATHRNTVTVPFLFDGRNSVLFQAARRLSQTLGYSLMFREICKLMGTTVSLTMRKPVKSEELSEIGNRKEVARYLRTSPMISHGTSTSGRSSTRPTPCMNA